MRQVETELGFALPDNYKEFLFKNNGGHPIKDTCTLLESYTNNEFNFETDVRHFAGMHNERYYDLVRDYRSMKDWRIPPELLTIAWNSGGDSICLCISGSNKGKVYFWFHENENPEENNPWYENIFSVANSFEDFINSLYVSKYDFKYDSELGVNKSTKCINTHDRYSLPLSRQVQKFGNKVTEFFAKAPAEVEDFIIEEIEANGNLILHYTVKSQNKKYIREINQLGIIIKEKEEII